MKKSEISIIIPVYNGEKYIDTCLRSLYAQRYNNWEAICVDDGSSDYTPVLLDAYGEKDQRIRVIHQSNSGVSLARMTGISAATGSYLMFIDVDDTLTPDALETLADKFAGEARSDIVIFGFNIIEGEEIKEKIPAFDRLDSRAYMKSVLHGNNGWEL